MKKIVVFVFLIILICSLAFASFDVHNISVEKSYPRGQTLRGEMNITLNEIITESLFRTNKGHEISIKDLLDKSASIYSCEPYDCSNIFEIKSSSEELELLIPRGQKKEVGFYLEGSQINILGIKLNMESDFGVSETVPLRIEFFENKENEWLFSEFSDIYRDPYYGFYKEYYQENYSRPGPVIGETRYCSELEIHTTTKIFAGAIIQVNNGEGELKLTLYNDGGTYLDSGLYNPHEVYGVFFERPSTDPFLFNTYYICIESEEGNPEYQIFVDDFSGTYKSFTYNENEETFNSAVARNRTRNYGIFVKEAIYADASKLENANFSFNFLEANTYILSKYGNDCSNGCFLPMTIYSNINQNLKLKNIELRYSKQGEEHIDNRIHEFEKKPGKISFSGIIDLFASGFKINEAGEYQFYINNELIYEEEIKITGAPIIKGILPRFLPAGINSMLFADIDFEGDKSLLTYEWDFGDRSSKTTNENKVFHKYTNISEYIVKLTIKYGELTNSFQTTINTISPREFVPLIFNQLSISINSSISDINSFPDWQRKFLRDSLNIDGYQDELNSIKRDIDNAYEDSDYLAIAEKLNQIDPPSRVFISETYEYTLLPTDKINLKPIIEHTNPYMDGTEEEYIDAILRWQDEYVDYTVNRKKVSFIKASGIKQDILTHYLITVKNNYYSESFFILDYPRDKIFFKAHSLDREPRSVKDALLFTLDEGESKTIEFYVHGEQELDFFSSPQFSHLVLEADIDETCNYNLICEPERGENWRNCRSDCKPVGLMIGLMIILAFLMLLIYTIIQIWYIKYYENILFEDKNRFHNLIMFVTVAQNKGMNREQIKKALREKGWANERINYVIKKANGERVGLYEIIPITKLMAYYRKKEIKNNPERYNRMTPPQSLGPPKGQNNFPKRRPILQRKTGRSGFTNYQQQNQGKINKDNNQNFNNKK